MKLGVIGLGSAFAVVVAVACSNSDKPSGSNCGAGTVLSGNLCVPSGGGEKSEAGATGCSGADCNEQAGASSPVAGQSFGANGAEAGGVGAATTGGTGGTGIVTAGVSAVGGDESGAGGDESAGAGGEPSGEGAPPATRWLAFSRNSSGNGSYVYDVAQYPSDVGLTKLSEGGNTLAWSPDGKWLVYDENLSYYSRNMTGAAPGAAQLLSPAGFPDGSLSGVRRFSWASDSHSVASVKGKTLTVFDPRTAAPPLHSVTTTLVRYEWAPVGNRLLYVDATGAHVVAVDAGSLGQPFDIDASARLWSPDGTTLVGVLASQLFLIRLDGASSNTASIASDYSPGSLSFSADGKKLAFSSGSELHFVQVRPTLGTVTTPYGSLQIGAAAGMARWSPVGSWLAYRIKPAGDPTWYVTDTSDGSALPQEIGAAQAADLVWNSGRPSPRLYWEEGVQARTYDPDASSPEVVTLTSTAGAAIRPSPLGDTAVWLSTHALHFVDALAPQAVSNDTTIDSGIVNAYVSNVTWSGDGKFVGIVESLDGRWQQWVVRVDAGVPSLAVKLAPYVSSTQAFQAFSP